MNIPILGRAIDECFLQRRLRSTSFAGVCGAVVAVGLFEYRLYANHIWSWDLLAVAAIMVLVKLRMMAWFRVTD